MTIDAAPLPQVSLGDEWAIASMQRWVLAMGRQPTVPASVTIPAGEPIVTDAGSLRDEAGPARAQRRAADYLRAS